ncbi:hypothetical protein DPMN_104578, partial [Dreissena polymorpha]
VGDLLPFISVFMRHLGLSSTETGIIYGVMPLITLLVRPLGGILADKMMIHKLMIAVCSLLTGISYCCLLLTPAKSPGEFQSTQMPLARTKVQCSPLDSFVNDCAKNGSTCPKSIGTLLENGVYNKSNLQCEFNCIRSKINPSPSSKACFTQTTGSLVSGNCDNTPIDTAKGVRFESKLQDILNNKIVGSNSTDLDQVCVDYDLRHMTFNGTEYWQMLCDSEVSLDCEITFANLTDFQACPYVTETSKLSNTFWIFFIIFFFANIVMSPVFTLIDAVAFDMLGPKPELWGRQRLWGTIGFTAFAVTSTFIMDAISQSHKTINYSVSFYIFMGLTTISAFVTYFLNPKNVQSARLLKNLKPLLTFKILAFLLVMMSFGMMNVVIEAYLFWFLQELGGPQKLLGLCVVFSCIPEMIMFHFAGAFIKKFGNIPCVLLACPAYAVRFFCYSFLSNPWFVLPVEMTHCFTFALMYASATGYANSISPEGLSATMQGVLAAVYWGIGKGIGSLVTGTMYDSVHGIGPRWTFRLYGFFALGVLALYGIVHFFFFRKKQASKEVDMTVTYEANKDEDGAQPEDKLLSPANQSGVELKDMSSSGNHM